MNEFDEKEKVWILLVDALDEAILTKGRTSIVRIIATIKNVLPPWLKIGIDFKKTLYNSLTCCIFL